jgi:hypothetical protein
MSKGSPSPKSRHLQVAEEKAKMPPYNVLPLNNRFRELLVTEANFLDDIQASISGISNALTHIPVGAESATLAEINDALGKFLQFQEQVFELMVNNKDPGGWSTAIYDMQGSYLQMLLLLKYTHFSDEANLAFKTTVTELGHVRQDIHSYLSKPMQRLQKYHLLIRELIRSMSDENLGNYNSFTQRSMKSLRDKYSQAYNRHMSIVEKCNLIYGIINAAQHYQDAMFHKKPLTLPLEKILTDCLRKKETGEYILPTEMICTALQGFLKDPTFHRALEGVIQQKKT